jgi:hypothetical protein
VTAASRTLVLFGAGLAGKATIVEAVAREHQSQVERVRIPLEVRFARWRQFDAC